MATKQLHPRNKHKGHYDFALLTKANPTLAQHVTISPRGDKTINFHDAKAVKELNKSILLAQYGLAYWDIPDHNLCPPIPGRADYIHYLADLFAECNPKSQKAPQGKNITGLDIGTGANLIYPIIGSQEYGWKWIGSDIEKTAIAHAQQIISSNKRLQNNIELRRQTHAKHIFKSIIQPSDFIDFTLCNPPFHSSAEEAAQGSKRKLKNLTKEPISKLNFGGQSNELWCDGGELTFIQNMINESVLFKNQCFWFSTLVSKQANLKPLLAFLKKKEPTTIKTIEMGQGNKISRFIAWTFLSPTQQKKWVAAKW